MLVTSPNRQLDVNILAIISLNSVFLLLQLLIILIKVLLSPNLFLLLQDVQCEIESHKEVFSSLNGTGRKLLGSLTSQDDAVMLQRRLDEMNQRWHHLKNKSMAIRFVNKF